MCILDVGLEALFRGQILCFFAVAGWAAGNTTELWRTGQREARLRRKRGVRRPKRPSGEECVDGRVEVAGSVRTLGDQRFCQRFSQSCLVSVRTRSLADSEYPKDARLRVFSHRGMSGGRPRKVVVCVRLEDHCLLADGLRPRARSNCTLSRGRTERPTQCCIDMNTLRRTAGQQLG